VQARLVVVRGAARQPSRLSCSQQHAHQRYVKHKRCFRAKSKTAREKFEFSHTFVQQQRMG
jgi:hypothetical protein